MNIKTADNTDKQAWDHYVLNHPSGTVFHLTAWKYAGSDFTFRRLGPNDFMYWELMKLAVEKGCRIFDYGSSKRTT